ncbi:radical SAM protein [archaeon]|jgi:radical SAM superfamily enzyme YgiQ (UPF0313 family)|nr:radical SAM protein [archaeon]
MGKPLRISFADLTYTTKGLSNNTFPFGISLVASYAKKVFGDKIDVEIFHYPKNFINYLENEVPEVICFSSFSWTLDISHEFAKKIKEKNPSVIVIFGGPNFPIEYNEKEKFLKKYSAIDFYVCGEGEKAFVELLKDLERYNFNKEKFKEREIKLGNCNYIYNGKLIDGGFFPRMENLDDIPSPYLGGYLDKFFDGVLIPINQIARGCPFRCAYCQEGNIYFCKISRFSRDRVKQELIYIANKIKVPNLVIADSNFGMYEEDVEISKDVSEVKETYNWPKYIESSLGKNKDTVLETVKNFKGGVFLGAPVQSTDAQVLENIHRTNISNEKIIEITKTGEGYGGNSFSEIILGLPGDSKNAHFKSMFDMIDLGINVVRAHQLLMLPGSEISTLEAREKYGIKTKFRLQPKCFGDYEVYGDVIHCSEIDELCVENNTMPYEDYLKCRKLDLSVEIFYNNGIFYELKCFLEKLGIKTSYFIEKINEKASESLLKELYGNFIKENEDCLWESYDKLEEHIKGDGMIEKYIVEKLRDNEQLKYRAIAFFRRMDDLHGVAFESARELLRETGFLDELKEKYLNELSDFSLLMKKELLNLDIVENRKFSFNFLKLLEKKFEVDPFDFMEETEINFFHTKEQKRLFEGYLNQFGKTENDLGIILSRSHANKFYRMVR